MGLPALAGPNDPVIYAATPNDALFQAARIIFLLCVVRNFSSVRVRRVHAFRTIAAEKLHFVSSNANGPQNS